VRRYINNYLGFGKKKVKKAKTKLKKKRELGMASTPLRHALLGTLTFNFFFSSQK